jgi:multiple sugar transport system substrate-binding protein
MRIAATGRVLAAVALACAAGCGGDPTGTVVTFPGSAVGAEAEVLRRHLGRFMEEHPDIRVETRVTPDAADERRQLYVQWLGAGAADPDVLQLDVIWTAEFAAAGWIRALDELGAEADDFFPAALEASRWRGRLHALPWFVDVGMLYWRTDLLERPPTTFDELVERARAAGLETGFVWQGARYEGLVTVFLEVLGGFGGEILDAEGRAAVDSEAGRRALAFLRDAVGEGVTPSEVLTWREEQTRFAFQNGRALFMRNWPYAAPLLDDPAASKVAGRFAVAAMPTGPGGRPTAALGGQQLAINAASDAPQAAWAVIEYLTRPEQMLERAEVAGQYPARPSLYADGRLEGLLAIPPAEVRRIVDAAVARPPIPLYPRLSEVLQIELHRALTGQASPEAALAEAARRMNGLLARAEAG